MRIRNRDAIVGPGVWLELPQPDLTRARVRHVVDETVAARPVLLVYPLQQATAANELDEETVVVVDRPPRADPYRTRHSQYEWMRDLHLGLTERPRVRIRERIRSERHRNPEVVQNAVRVVACTRRLGEDELLRRVVFRGESHFHRPHDVADGVAEGVGRLDDFSRTGAVQEFHACSDAEVGPNLA